MNKIEFRRRRKRVMEVVGESGIAIIPTAPVRPRNRDIEYPYRPDSDFYYLTGFAEPEAVAVFLPGRAGGEYLLFCRENDPEQERWHGSRIGLEAACDKYGADDAFPVGDLDDILPGLLEGRSRVYYAMGYSREFDQRLLGWVTRLRERGRAGTNSPAEFIALDHVLHDLRLYKSQAEIKVMEEAIAVSTAAHRRAMRVCRPGMNEGDIEAEIVHEFMLGGCRSVAYPSIVAGGRNACVLHYTRNDASLRDGDLLLIDAGAERDCYAADITRTFPVNGRFSPAQRAIYALVLAAQSAAIAAVRPGNHWNDPHQEAVRVMTEGLLELGLLKGRLSNLLKRERYRSFYMHRTGHWLGMDVHDVGDYKIGDEWRVLEPGMVLTVEPGLYISEGARGVARKWWNIGVRIEDYVLVTRDGVRVLTAAAPKAIDEIEALVGSG